MTHVPRASWPLPAVSQVPFPTTPLAQLAPATLASWLFPSQLVTFSIQGLCLNVPLFEWLAPSLPSELRALKLSLAILSQIAALTLPSRAPPGSVLVSPSGLWGRSCAFYLVILSLHWLERNLQERH